ncbi:MAG: hypothetical protein RL516_932 [Bacteroidota bacterium]|jgi:hypothetical protein
MNFVELEQQLPSLGNFSFSDRKGIRSYKFKSAVFLTLNFSKDRICLRLPAVEQSIFIDFAPGIIWKVPNHWGNYGWTLFSIKQLEWEVVHEAIIAAMEYVVIRKIQKKLN